VVKEELESLFFPEHNPDAEEQFLLLSYLFLDLIIIRLAYINTAHLKQE
jgi:hypothetical protein